MTTHGIALRRRAGSIFLLAALAAGSSALADDTTSSRSGAAGPAAAVEGSPRSAQEPAAGGEAAPPPAQSRYRPDRFAGRAGRHYQLAWGIDSLSVKLMESGLLVRFSYRVLDPDKAAVLNDKRNEASLIDPEAGVSLVVPTMERVGQLRQTSKPEAGRAYWMAFSNKGRLVKRGDRVDVVIGGFRANNLVVD